MREVLGLVVIAVALVLVAIRLQRRWNHMRAGYLQLEEYADALLQHGQGMILGVQAIVNDLSADHPVRVRVEHALSRAERDLSELRGSLQAHCSSQPHDTIG